MCQTQVTPNYIGSMNVDISYIRSIGSEKRAERYDSWNEIFLLLTKKENFNLLFTKVDGLIELGHERINTSIHLQKFNDIYFHSNNINDRSRHGRIINLVLFGSLGVIFLLVALTNYILLFSVRSLERAKEVCIRKVYGCNIHYFSGIR